MSLRLSLRADANDQNQRVDVVVARHSDLSRERARSAIGAGRVSVNGVRVTKASMRVAELDSIDVDVEEPQPIAAQAEPIPLTIVYEDADLVVIDKPAGLVVHPAPGHDAGTLVNALLHHCQDLAGIGDALRPGIVHRIDRFTSGLLVVSKNDPAHACLQAQFARHTVEREYRALCARVGGSGLPDLGSFDTAYGRHPTERKRFTGRAGARRATTHFAVDERFADGALAVTCRLETGRTHQIRVHLSEAGVPLLGDSVYAPASVANSPLISRCALHARTLGFTHPDGTRLYFVAEPPDDFQAALSKLRRGASWRR